MMTRTTLVRLVVLVGTLLLLSMLVESIRPVAIVTGGTRGIGSGIATCLAEEGYDLLVTYNTNRAAAKEFVQQLVLQHETTSKNSCRIVLVGGDLALPETRNAIFQTLDHEFPESPLQALVHNAGQYVGITAENSAGLTHTTSAQVQFGDGSMVDPTTNNTTNFDTLRYYQQLYGEAFIDLCEGCLPRMAQHRLGASILGTSSPGVTAALYGPQVGYSMPGAGKCLMEYSMRIYALQAAKYGVTVNVIVPGVVHTQAWEKVAQARGMKSAQELMDQIVKNDNGAPLQSILQPRDIGNLAAFLCSERGRFITGTVIPCDGGLHLKR